MRPPSAWLIASALAVSFSLTVTTSSSAQLVEVPTFVAGVPTPGNALAFLDVAAGADDAMVFTWVESTTANELWPAYARHVSADGATLATPVRLDSGNGVVLTRIVADGQGGYVAAWEGRGQNSYAIDARRLAADGQPAAPPITVDADGNPFRSLAVAASSTGIVVAWRSGTGVSARRYDASGQPLGPEFAVRTKALAADPRVRVAFLGGGGFLVSWFELVGSWARHYDASGDPMGEAFELASEFQSWDLAVSPIGGFAVVGSRDVGTHALPAGVWARRFDAAAQPLGPAFVVNLPTNSVSGVAAAYDPAGDLVVTWTQNGPGAQHVRARLYGADGAPRGAAFDASDEVAFSDHLLAVRPDGLMVNGWLEGFELHANVLAPCVAPFHTGCGDGVLTPPCERCDDGAGNSDTTADACRTNCARPSCGDGVVDAGEQCDDGNLRGCDGCDAECMLEVGWACGDGTALADCGEQCDDGAANSDDTPDACRTDCRLPTCGDDVIDTGETCDDGNRTPCDGCSDFCISEPGLGCGDGIAEPHCGEPCDDGNTIDGDGCVESCRLETIPGGGPSRTDCRSAWVVDNPANAPRYDKNGFISAQQVCHDGDPLCDFDGVADGRCTMRMRVCANVSGLPSCYPGYRLFSWTLLSPSAGKAAQNPAMAAVRAAFSSVPGVLVGPTTSDNCTDMFHVVVPLRTSADGPRLGKLLLKSRAENYGGERDTDTLRLVCMPAG